MKYSIQTAWGDGNETLKKYGEALEPFNPYVAMDDNDHPTCWIELKALDDLEKIIDRSGEALALYGGTIRIYDDYIE